MECVRLRIKDVDFQRKQLLVRNGKGQKDRSTILLDNVIEPLQRQITYAMALHNKDLAQGYGSFRMPWPKSIHMPLPMSAGTGFFPPESSRSIPAQASNNGTICIRVLDKEW
jgi:hypothetical protein